MNIESTQPRAALYLRVSTEQQSVENQRPHLVQLARARGLDIVAVYEEKVSATRRRPAFDKMILSAHRGELDCLLVWSLDRLGRSLQDNVANILRLDSCGVRIVSHQEAWLDNAGPVRDLLIAIFSWVAEQERRRIGERTRAGLERAKKKGVKLGRPRASFDIEQAVLLREEGLSMRQAAKKLGIGASTLCKALKLHEALGRCMPTVQKSGIAEATSNSLESRPRINEPLTSVLETPDAAE